MSQLFSISRTGMNEKVADLGFVRIIFWWTDSASLFDVLPGVRVGSVRASAGFVAVRNGAVHQLLLAERNDLIGSLTVVELEWNCSCKHPAWAAVVLVLDGWQALCITVVHLFYIILFHLVAFKVNYLDNYLSYLKCFNTKSIGLEKLYNFGFESVKIGPGVWPQIHENCESGTRRSIVFVNLRPNVRSYGTEHKRVLIDFLKSYPSMCTWP